MSEALNRRGFLKISAALAAVPVVSELTGTYLFAQEAPNLIQNGEVVTGTHWGVL
ncbi:MAG: hypothetical protein GX170_09035, partial [Campylobacteraceae bacterium]|nr:hypothetical protein [Campylobacteraceae bacterium]